MGQLIELPSKKVLDYASIHGLPHTDPLKAGWRVTHHYVDGETKDFDFTFGEAEGEDMIRHLRSLTTDHLK